MADLLDLVHQFLVTCLVLCLPFLVSALVVGGAVGFVQAATQIQDPAIAFVCKVLLIGLVLALCLPWMMAYLDDYARWAIQAAAVPSIGE